MENFETGYTAEKIIENFADAYIKDDVVFLIW